MFKEYNQSQESLVPLSLKEFLWKKHEAVLLNDLIEKLNLDPLYNTYDNTKSKWWASAFHPKMLLKIIFYAYMTQTFSSRWIAKRLHSDIAYMYLAGNNQPDFRTINRFRGERLVMIKDIFKQIVVLLKDLWLISFWTISIDGTKIYANASKNNNYTEEGLDKTIEGLLKQAESIDEEEDRLYGDREDNIPDELADPETRRKRIDELIKGMKKKKEIVQEEKKKKENEGIKQNNINMTDRDSRFMKMKKKDFANGYNMQIASENQYIITNYVSNNPWDVKDFIPTVENIKNEHEDKPKIIRADKWYSSTDNYEYLEKEGIEWYIPLYNDIQVDMSKYAYNKERDEYKDKEGNIYKLRQYVWVVGAKRWGRKKDEPTPKEWEYRWKLYITTLTTGKKKYLEISEKWHKYQKIYKERMWTEKWKEIYNWRQTDIETIFANIKHNFWFDKLNLRGFKKVNIELSIWCLTHNLKKLFISWVI